MKKLMLAIATALLFFESCGQKRDPPPALTRQDYLEKNRKQETAAWIMLGGGLGLFLGGVGVANLVEENESAPIGTAMAYIGLGAIGGSTPLLIASGKNWRKAVSTSLKFQRVRQFQNLAFVNKPLPSLTVKFTL